MKKIILLLTIGLITACSSFDKQTYYSVDAKPDKLKTADYMERCGSKAYDGKPDIYLAAGGEVSSIQRKDLYLWGPFIVTVVPTFPIVWVAQALQNDDLTVSVTRPKDAPVDTYYITTTDNKAPIYPSKVTTSYYDQQYVRLWFPVSYKDLESFSLHIGSSKENILFEKSYRWYWTSWALNGC